jgi:hypothetical protein
MIKLDFITNSSSTSFIIADLSGKIKENGGKIYEIGAWSDSDDPMEVMLYETGINKKQLKLNL